MASGDCASCGSLLIDSECKPCAGLLSLLLHHPPEPCRLCTPPAGEKATTILPALGRMEGERGELDAAIWDCHRCGAVRKMPLAIRVTDAGASSNGDVSATAVAEIEF